MEKKASLNIIAAAALWGCIGLFLKLLTAAVVALAIAAPTLKSGAALQRRRLAARRKEAR